MINQAFLKALLRLFLSGLALYILTSPAFSEEDDLAQLRLIITQDGQPLPDVVMYVDDEDEIVTNENGKASIDVYSGVHAVILEYDDIDIADLNVVVSFGETVTIVADIQADADIPSIEIESTGVSGANTASGVGSVTGQILSGIDSQPVPNAKIIVLGSAAEVSTDAEGFFSIENIPGGSYGLTVTQEEYKSFSLDHFVVVANEPINLDMTLFPIMKASIDTPIDDIAIEEVIVTAKYVADESSIAGALEAVRLSADVTELISADQIAKSGASDAAAALNRVSGVNVGSNNFVNIRGLPARYSKTTWNGSELPSTDPVRRTIPLDIFPTDVLKGISVQKSYSADKPGEFGGGLVDLQTISIPEEDYFKISIGAGGNTETTFRDGLTYTGGDDDFWGVDDGTRDFPDRLEELTNGGRKALSGPGGILSPCTPSATLNCLGSQAELDELDNLFFDETNSIQVRERKIDPDVGFSAAAGKRWDRDWYTFGLNAAIGFDNEWQSTDGRRSTSFDIDTTSGELGFEFGGPRTEVRTENEITLGGILAMGLEFGDATTFKSNTFFQRQTTDTTSIANSFRNEGASNTERRTHSLEWVENEIFTQQFQGLHDLASYFRLPVGLNLDWRYLIARTSRDVPNSVTYNYSRPEGAPPGTGGFISPLNRLYEYTIDKTRNFAADLDLALWEDSSFPMTISTGYSYLTQRRSNRSFEIFSDIAMSGAVDPLFSNQNPNIAIQSPLLEFGQAGLGPVGDFDGSQKVSATYIGIEQGLFEVLRLNAGVRFEEADINVNGESANAPFSATIEDYDELPAIGATWFINDNMQLRAAWGDTLVRPNIRELSPVIYDDSVLNEDFIGNQNLVTSKIDNRDIRFEWYFGDSENFSIGYFEKDIENPIEVISFSTSNPVDPFDLTFATGTEAEVEGYEFSWRKNLGFLGKIGLPNSLMEQLFFYGNYSIIDSETTVDRNATNALDPGGATIDPNTSFTSNLTGQPDWLVNIAIGYEGDNTEATILYNQVDDFIFATGPVTGAGGPNEIIRPDFINESEPSLDFIFKTRIFNDFKLGFKAKNILNPNLELTQGGEIVTNFRNGREYSFSLSWEPENLN